MKRQRAVLVGYLTISTIVSCYKTRCRRQYYLPLATQLMHAPVRGARNTVQQLLCKILGFISPEL